MFNIITKCKLNFTNEQTFISFDDFNIEWVINSTIRSIVGINENLEISNPPFRLVCIENETFAKLTSYSVFFEFFLKRLNDEENQDKKDILQRLNQNESEIIISIEKFNNYIKEFKS